MLEGFTAFNFNEGAPYVSITKNGVTFNKGVILKLKQPAYVLLLINSNDQLIAVQVCEKEEPNSVPFFNDDKKGNVFSVRWNQKDLLNTLSDLMGWDLKSESYKVMGTLIPNESAMIFDLSKAELIT
ncbi:MAG: hypothetical protein ACI4VK_00745 [Candidatus Coproplasma sp.]